MKNFKIKVALTVASSDSGCGAGVQADMLSFVQNGVYATMAIASLTAQNPNRVSSIFPVSSDFLREQIESIDSYFKIDAIKCGMLYDKDNIEVLADFIKKNPHIKFVADTVMIATSRAKLLKDDAIIALEEKLLPLADLITPNLDEARVLLNAGENEDILTMAKQLRDKFKTSVLLKGGHLDGDDIRDILYLKDDKVHIYQSDRIKDINTHGSGCTLSASICANLAKGLDLVESVENARKYIIKGMKNSIKVGGDKFINHIF